MSPAACVFLSLSKVSLMFFQAYLKSGVYVEGGESCRRGDGSPTPGSLWKLCKKSVYEICDKPSNPALEMCQQMNSVLFIGWQTEFL